MTESTSAHGVPEEVWDRFQAQTQEDMDTYEKFASACSAMFMASIIESNGIVSNEELARYRTVFAGAGVLRDTQGLNDAAWMVAINISKDNPLFLVFPSSIKRMDDGTLGIISAAPPPGTGMVGVSAETADAIRGADLGDGIEAVKELLDRVFQSKPPSGDDKKHLH